MGKTLFDKKGIQNLHELTASGLVAQALASGDVNSVKDGLRKKNLEVPVREALKQMQICLHRVRGSEEDRDSLLYVNSEHCESGQDVHHFSLRSIHMTYGVR